MKYNKVLERLITTRKFEAKDRILDVKFCIPASIGEVLYETIRQNNMKNCLEIGTLFGFSSLFIAQALEEIDGELTIVDPEYESIKWDGEDVSLGDAAKRHIREAGYHNRVKFIKGFSQWILPNLQKEGHRYQFIFIDGDHRFASVLLDFILADSMLDVGGVIAMDDIGWEMACKEGLDGCANRVLAHLFSTNRYRIEIQNPNFCLCWKVKGVGQ